MRAQSLQICLVGGCNASCPFCISKTTWRPDDGDNAKLFDGLERAFRFAKWHGVDSVMITGKGETTLVKGYISVIDNARNAGFPSIEIQTNGSTLSETAYSLKSLKRFGLTGIAVSVASPDPVRNAKIMGLSPDHDYLSLIERISECGMLSRVTLNMIEGEISVEGLREWADLLVSKGAHQLTLRRLGVPDEDQRNTEACASVRSWVMENALSLSTYDFICEEVDDSTLIRTTAFNTEIHDYRGLSTVIVDCLTIPRTTDDITSMILMPDGHVYSSWGHRGSILI